MRFYLDYSGGWGSFGSGYWRRVGNACTAYTGPPPAHLVFACDAPDGSFWALQTWRRELRDGGWPTTGIRLARELQLSHWSGPLPDLFVDTDWIYQGRFDHLFGYLTYAGQPVYGFSSNKVGAPLDTYGRTQPAKGDEYRATVMGPGVTPILQWPAPRPYDRTVDLQKNAEQQSFTTPADSCWHTY